MEQWFQSFLKHEVSFNFAFCKHNIKNFVLWTRILHRRYLALNYLQWLLSLEIRRSYKHGRVRRPYWNIVSTKCNHVLQSGHQICLFVGLHQLCSLLSLLTIYKLYIYTQRYLLYMHIISNAFAPLTSNAFMFELVFCWNVSWSRAPSAHSLLVSL